MLEAAIARVTATLTMVADEDIPALVEERRAMREELARAVECGADVAQLEDPRARRR